MKYFIVFILINTFILPAFGKEESKVIKDNRSVLFSTPSKSISTEITCIQTAVNGDVTISWTQAADPTNSFTEYQIHTSQNGLIATINSINTLSYTHLGVTQKFDYFITVVSTLDGSSSTEVISNIFLSVNNPSDGTAILTWNNPLTNIGPNMGAYVKIYQEYPAGVWSVRDSVLYGVTFYKDTIDICQAFINYKIVVPNQPCDFTSNSAGDNFKDITTPDIPKISQVSIDTLTNNVVISWNINHQKDTQGYLVYMLDGLGIPSQIASIPGRLNTMFSYSPNLNDGPFTYSISAFDACPTSASALSFQTSAKAEVQTTMKSSSSLNICNKDVTISWTEYKGWPAISNYEVWGHIIGQAWKSFGSTSLLEFHVTGESLQEYCFAIKALSTDGREAFSNRTCLKIISPTPPAFNYIKTATINNDKVELHLYIEVGTGVKEIMFQRLNKENVFEEIGRLPVTNSEILFIDSTIFINKESYTYRAIVIDSCGNLGMISNTAKTILLSIQTDDLAMKHYLNWTKYEQFNGSTLEYKIYRGLDGIFSKDPLITLSNSQHYFEDEISKIDYTGKACYYIEAIEGDNIYGTRESSISNTSCSILKPIIYLPNSFTPNGDKINDLFLPIVSLIDVSNYKFTIFNLWEHPIFESSDPEQGWTGTTSSGKIAEPGTYVYLLKVTDGNNIEIIKRGHINLIK